MTPEIAATRRRLGRPRMAGVSAAQARPAPDTLEILETPETQAIKVIGAGGAAAGAAGEADCADRGVPTPEMIRSKRAFPDQQSLRVPGVPDMI